MTNNVIKNYTKEKDVDRVNKIEEILHKKGKDKVVIWYFSEIESKEIPENLEAIILSGSRAHLQNNGVYSEYYDEVNLITKANVPILGICFGHQLIERHFVQTLSLYRNSLMTLKISRSLNQTKF